MKQIGIWKIVLTMSLVAFVSSVQATGSNHHNTTNNEINTTNNLPTAYGGDSYSNSTNFNHNLNDNYNNNRNTLDNYSNNQNTNSNVSDAYSNSHSQSNSNANSNSGADSNSNATGGQSNSNSGSSSGGNSMNTTYSNNVQRQHHNTPSMSLFVPPPTSPCVVTYGGSGAGAGFGFSIAGGVRNANCEKLEVAKALSSIGQLDASLEMICNTDHAKDEDLSACEVFKERRQAKVKRVSSVVSKEEANSKITEIEPTVNGTRMAKNSLGQAFWFNTISTQWVQLN